MYLVVLYLVLYCVFVLLQMTRRSPKGKNIVTNDQSTPVAKRTLLSSQSSKDSNCERFRTPFNSRIYSSIFDVASPIVERVVEIGQTYSGILKTQWMNWLRNATLIQVTLELS